MGSMMTLELQTHSRLYPQVHTSLHTTGNLCVTLCHLSKTLHAFCGLLHNSVISVKLCLLSVDYCITLCHLSKTLHSVNVSVSCSWWACADHVQWS